MQGRKTLIVLTPVTPRYNCTRCIVQFLYGFWVCSLILQICKSLSPVFISIRSDEMKDAAMFGVWYRLLDIEMSSLLLMGQIISPMLFSTTSVRA